MAPPALRQKHSRFEVIAAQARYPKTPREVSARLNSSACPLRAQQIFKGNVRLIRFDDGDEPVIGCLPGPIGIARQ